MKLGQEKQVPKNMCFRIYMLLIARVRVLKSDALGVSLNFAAQRLDDCQKLSVIYEEFLKFYIS